MAALHRVTPKKKAQFLDALAQTGNVRQAAKAVGFSANRFYVHRRQDPLFAQKWEETIQQAMDTVLEPEAIRRAVDGVEKAVYYRGAVALLRQLVKDTQSRRLTIQAEARAFLASEGLRFWAEVLDCDVTRLQRAVQRSEA